MFGFLHGPGYLVHLSSISFDSGYTTSGPAFLDLIAFLADLVT